ncbi:hypothetical protein [Desulfosporosinus orientis]|uniref:hypothetical protein n=1 Tax=Desulfosporosinus orientis TaxID=1563 RepID=UPI0005AA6207|nr:hypothetical protein [Desulfosporosinus orientis]
MAWRGDKSPQSGCGECGTWFTSGTTRWFGGAPAAASGRASECWMSGCGEAARPGETLFQNMWVLLHRHE